MRRDTRQSNITTAQTCRKCMDETIIFTLFYKYSGFPSDQHQLLFFSLDRCLNHSHLELSILGKNKLQ